MQKTVLLIVVFFAAVAFGFAQDQDDNSNTNDQVNQFKQLDQHKDQKGPKDQKGQKNGNAGTYQSPYASDISKTSFGAATAPLAQAGSVSNANPQHANALPPLDFHHKQGHQATTTHDPKQDKKAAAKAPYDPAEYKTQVPAK